MKRNELKVIIAIILVMSTMFMLASFVSSGFVQEIIRDDDKSIMSSSSENHTCNYFIFTGVNNTPCNRCDGWITAITYQCICGRERTWYSHVCRPNNPRDWLGENLLLTDSGD